MQLVDEGKVGEEEEEDWESEREDQGGKETWEGMMSKQ